MILIDSNMWCFYFDASAKEHHRAVKAIDSVLSKEQILSSTVVLMEASHFLVRNLGTRIGKTKIDTLFSFPMTVVDFDADLLNASINMLCNYAHAGIGGRDATLLAALKKAKTNRIMTHDASFKDVDWLHVIDPVEG
jgi:predicted nucleic acid-binding protein